MGVKSRRVKLFGPGRVEIVSFLGINNVSYEEKKFAGITNIRLAVQAWPFNRRSTQLLIQWAWLPCNPSTACYETL